MAAGLPLTELRPAGDVGLEELFLSLTSPGPGAGASGPKDPMTTAVTVQPAPNAQFPPIPFGLLLRAEWSETTSTRAARWLLAAVALIAIGGRARAGHAPPTRPRPAARPHCPNQAEDAQFHPLLVCMVTGRTEDGQCPG